MISRKLWKLAPLGILCIIVWCIIFQESFLLDRTEVHQEIVYKFNALEKHSLNGDLQSPLSPDIIDKAIINELLLQSKLKKHIKKNTTADKTKTWFDRTNPPPSTRPLSAHPFFLGYVIENPDLCGNEPADILIYIHSAVEHFGQRRAIRESWAGTKLFHDISIRTVFILGRPATHSDQTDILSEFAAHGDIVQGNFKDNFRNLTYKAVTMLGWVNWHCPQAKYIIKADDDYFVDTFRIVEDFIPELSNKFMTLQCRHSKNFEIIRNTHSKWHIEGHILQNRTHWPPFCSGFFVVFTGDLVPILYENSFMVEELVSVDDAYLFGLLTEGHPNVTFINIHDKISVNTRPRPEDEISKNVRFEFSVFEIELPETARILWDLRMKRLSDWGRAHSLFVKLFESPVRRTIVL